MCTETCPKVLELEHGKRVTGAGLIDPQVKSGHAAKENRFLFTVKRLIASRRGHLSGSLLPGFHLVVILLDSSKRSSGHASLLVSGCKMWPGRSKSASLV